MVGDYTNRSVIGACAAVAGIDTGTISRAAEYEALKVMAQQAGIGAEEFLAIVKDVGDRARGSMTWGRPDEQVSEIRRRIYDTVRGPAHDRR